jgi:DNA (cytosine-5)-methyltransferase 1
MDRSAYNQGVNANVVLGIDENGVAFSHIAKGPGAVCYIDTSHADDVVRTDDVVAPLQARDYKGGKMILCVDSSVCNGSGFKEDTSYTLNVRDRHCVAYKNPRYIVRRLTPLECERLQGFPDGWTDIGEYADTKGKVKKTSDSARYKALGNSIALPPWKWVLKRLCSHYERDATLASLFDGIGGFPYIWEQINGKGTALWASEIEDFPMAVTKVRIGE